MDDLDISLGQLTDEEWAVIAQIAQYPGRCRISLQNIRMARPAGSIALILALKHRRRIYNNILLPTDAKTRKYLIQVDFTKVAMNHSVRFNEPHGRLERIYRNDNTTFTEILNLALPSSEDKFKSVMDYLKSHFPSNASSAFSTFEEVALNIRHHTSNNHRPATHIIQVQEYKKGLDLAFGDLGIGFLRSLQRNPAYLSIDSEEKAIEKAVLEKASGLGHQDENRGGGLRKALDGIKQLGGSFTLASGDGIAKGSSETEEFEFTTMPEQFPGTLMAAHIPFPRTIH